MNKDWLNSQITSMLLKKYSKPMTPQDRIKGGASVLPVVGDAISGYDAYQAAKRGNYGEAALNAIGLLPLIPSIAGVTKSHVDDILTAIYKEGKRGGTYGLRVVPHGDITPSLGDILNPSYKWKDGEMTGRALRGTSTIGISKINEVGIMDAFIKLGIHDNAKYKRPFYMGKDVVLVKGINKGKGADLGERLIKDGRVVWKGEKITPGNSDLK